MEVNYSADIAGIDEAPAAAKIERPTKPIRLRLQPGIFRLKADHTDGSGVYQGWRGVSWTVECPEPEDAIAVRDALRLFFEAVGAFGATQVQASLARALEQESVSA